MQFKKKGSVPFKGNGNSKLFGHLRLKKVRFIQN
jgi:hypothetical protein